MRADVLSVIETGYRLDLALEDWVREVALAIEPLIDDDQELWATAYDHRRPPAERLFAVTAPRPPLLLQEALKDRLPRIPSKDLEVLIPAVPFAGWTIATFSRTPAGRAALVDFPWADALGLACPSGPHTGVMVGIVSPSARTRKVAQASWLRVAMHLSNAARLRGSLAAGAAPPRSDRGGIGYFRARR